MESSNRQRVFDPDDEARSEEEELVQKIAGMILDGRDAMETKSEDEARSAFINSTTFIYTLSAHGTMPKNGETKLEKRMGQLVASASELDDTFGLAHCISGTNMGGTAMAIIGAYRFGMQKQVSQAAQAQSSTSLGATAGQSKLSLPLFKKIQVDKRKLSLGSGTFPSDIRREDGSATKKRSTRGSGSKVFDTLDKHIFDAQI